MPWGSVGHLKLSCRKLNQDLQILTGHGNLATHRHKMGKVQSPLCPMCHEADKTYQNFVGDCPAYLNARISHFDYHRVELCDVVKHDRIFKLASFVHKTKRLEKVWHQNQTESIRVDFVKGKSQRLYLCDAKNRGMTLNGLWNKYFYLFLFSFF